MRKLIALGFAVSLSLFTAPARADQWGGCLVGPNDLNRCVVTGAPATVMAAVAAPILVAGAVVTIADELNHGHQELPPGTVTQANKKPSLSYVPAAAEDPYRNHPERAGAPSPAFKFNDTASNVVTAVTAAAVVGAIIGTVASSASKPGAGKH